MTDAEPAWLPVGRVATVDVPATSANLGPGFDAFGLALDWRDRYRVEIIPAGSQVAVTGADPVPGDDQNLVLHSVRAGLGQIGWRAPGLALTGTNSIPHGRGLGSSAAAIAAGLTAAQLLAGSASGTSVAVEPERFLSLADRIEGHPDNVAAALAGGLVLVYRRDDAEVAMARPAVHPDLTALALIPDAPVSTEQARGLLPVTVPHTQAVDNGARAALLVHALTAEPDLLYDATKDRLHQDRRATVMPESADLLKSLRSRGVPAVLSGAGPTILVLGRSADLDRASGVDAPGFRPVRVGIGAGASGFVADGSR